MTAGRPPRPKRIQGDLRGDKRRLNAEEIQAPEGYPVCPEHLEGIAREEWFSVCDQLKTIGLLSTVDQRTIELYCRTYQLYRQADEALNNEDIDESARYLGSATTRRNLYAKELNGYLNALGLNPGARARMRVQAEKKSESKLANIIRFKTA